MSRRGPHPEFGPWDRFWSEYMVWSLRLACYASNLYFFDSARASLESAFPPQVVAVALLAYSVFVFWLIERFFARRHNPDYEHLSLTPKQRRYRVGRERLIYSCLLFTATSFGLGFLSALALSAPVALLDPMAKGFAGLLASVFGVFLGVVFMTARGQTSGRRVPALYPLGIAAFLVPTLFVLLTLKNEFFPGPTAWW